MATAVMEHRIVRGSILSEKTRVGSRYEEQFKRVLLRLADSEGVTVRYEPVALPVLRNGSVVGTFVPDFQLSDRYKNGRGLFIEPHGPGFFSKTYLEKLAYAIETYKLHLILASPVPLEQLNNSTGIHVERYVSDYWFIPFRPGDNKSRDLADAKLEKKLKEILRTSVKGVDYTAVLRSTVAFYNLLATEKRVSLEELRRN